MSSLGTFLSTGSDLIDIAVAFLGAGLSAFVWLHTRNNRRARAIAEMDVTIEARKRDEGSARAELAALRGSVRRANAERRAAAGQATESAVQRALHAVEAGDEKEAARRLEDWWQGARLPLAEIAGRLGEWYAKFTFADLPGRAGAAPSAETAEAARILAVRHLLLAANLAPERTEWQGMADALAASGDPIDDAALALQRQHFTLPAGLRQEEAEHLNQALLLRAIAQLDAGNRRGAYLIADRAALIGRRSLGHGARPTLTAEFYRSQSLRMAGFADRALPIVEASWIGFRDHKDFGPGHPETLANRVELAMCLRDLGRVAEALPISEDVWRTRCAHADLGPDHPQTVSLERFYSHCLAEVGRTEDALSISENARVRARRLFGDRGEETLSASFTHAQVLGRLGRHHEALQLAEETWTSACRHKALGEDHPDTMAMLHVLPGEMLKLGRAAEALPLAEQVWEFRRNHASYGEDHPDTIAAAHLLATVLAALGRSDEALAMARHAFAHAAHKLPSTHPLVADTFATILKLLPEDERKAIEARSQALEAEAAAKTT
ncbi:MAG: tetratricopeptide repeat protein [Hyphomicrobiaceae bacterium]